LPVRYAHPKTISGLWPAVGPPYELHRDVTITGRSVRSMTRRRGHDGLPAPAASRTVAAEVVGYRHVTVKPRLQLYRLGHGLEDLVRIRLSRQVPGAHRVVGASAVCRDAGSWAQPI
jgi:hypothetical protein